MLIPASCAGIFSSHRTTSTIATEIPVLINAAVRGQQRKLIAMANRNGFYYLVDRTTGEFLLGTPYAKQTWAKGLNDSGRPLLLPNSAPSVQGTLVYPSLQGQLTGSAHPIARYSPQTDLFYVAVREMGSYYYKGDASINRAPFLGAEANVRWTAMKPGVRYAL